VASAATSSMRASSAATRASISDGSAIPAA
jgi:hypothetical protein